MVRGSFLPSSFRRFSACLSSPPLTECDSEDGEKIRRLCRKWFMVHRINYGTLFTHSNANEFHRVQKCPKTVSQSHPLILEQARSIQATGPHVNNLPLSLYQTSPSSSSTSQFERGLACYLQVPVLPSGPRLSVLVFIHLSSKSVWKVTAPSAPSCARISSPSPRYPDLY